MAPGPRPAVCAEQVPYGPVVTVLVFKASSFKVWAHSRCSWELNEPGLSSWLWGPWPRHLPFLSLGLPI